MYTQRLIGALLVAALLLFPAGTALAQDESIVDIAVGNEDLSTLVAVLVEAGLVEDLAADGPFTLFAPTNEAFAALPEGLLDTLRGEPTGDLTDILLYHVLPGQIMAADLSDGQEAGTLQDGFVVFGLEGDAAMINHASIVTTDIVASNGVIHLIDQVLLPPAVAESLGLSTPEPTAEATAETTEETTEEATPEPTEEPTAEAEEEMAEPTATPVAEEEATEDDAADDEAADDEATDDEATEEVEVAQEEAVAVGPSVIATDQTTTNGTMVTVDAVNATESGWLVIHLDQDGRPGSVIGQTAVPTGDTQNVIVFLEEEISGETVLWAMLHVDAGESGVYEFPGADVPARVDDDIVMTSFTVAAPAAAVPEMTPTPVAEAEAMEEATEEPTAEPAEEPEAEMAESTATPVAEEEPAAERTATPVAAEEGADDDEDMAPTSLPATGGGMTGTPLAISVAALLLLGLAAGTLHKRRHLA